MEHPDTDLDSIIDASIESEIERAAKLFARNRDEMDAIRKQRLQEKRGSNADVDLHAVQDHLSCCQRNILERVSALMLIRLLHQGITNQSADNGLRDRQMEESLRKSGQLVASHIVTNMLGEFFGENIWLPAVHRVVLRARALAPNLMIKTN